MHSVWVAILMLGLSLPAIGQVPLPSGAEPSPSSTAASSGASRGTNASTPAKGETAASDQTRNPPNATRSARPTLREGGAKGSPRGEASAVEEVKPEVMYLRDQSGRLVPVPGFSYEDFLELLRLKQQAQGPVSKPPDYSIQQAVVDGESDGKIARLSARFDIQTRRADWVQVPLGLGTAALSSAATYEGRGDYFLNYDEETQQYVAWLRGAAGTEHHLTLPLRVAISASGSQHKLSLALARAATSKLTLKVPAAEAVASVVPADLVAEVSSEGQSSTISILGIDGDFTVAWSEAPRAAAHTESLLEASGLIAVRIDGRSVTTEATLTVRSFGASFDRFHVRIPQGAALVGPNQPGYSLTQDPAMLALVEVKLDRPTTGPVDVKLVTERAFDLTRPETLELAGFEVTEALPHRQGGQIGISVAGDWQVLWQKRSRVRQIDEPAEPLERRDLIAAFEYVGQPSSLTVRVAPRQPRISVEPEYVYYVDAYQTQLEARLKYSIRGAKVFSVDLDLPGWEVDEIGPLAFVDARSAVKGEDARLRIPFLQPMIGDVEIVLRAHRPHSANPGDIELQLPVLKDATAGPATVAIVPEDNVELTTRTSELVALSPQRTPTGLDLPTRRQDALVFRGERPNAKYVAGLTVHPQKITVQVANTAQVGRAGVEIEQQFQYQVFYEPVERLSFAVPASIAAQHPPEMYVDGKRATIELAPDDEGGADTVRMQLTLAEPRAGLLQVINRIHLPLVDPRPATTIPLDLPLVMPLEGAFAANTLTTRCEPGFAVEWRSGPWKLLEQDRELAGRNLRLASATAATVAPLSLVVEDRPVGSATIVERAWVQTWLADATRQERAVFRIASERPQISLVLPADVNVGEIEALLDGEVIRPSIKNGGELIITWPAANRTHTLDLRYAYMESASASSIAWNAPDFGNDIQVRRTYWQLVLPRDRHLLVANSSLTPEFDWTWNRLGWSRANVLDQAQLEEWTGALHESGIPDAMNVYLFSTIGRTVSPDVWTARRGAIVFLASAAVLAVVLLWLYTTWLRRPAVWFLLGGATLALTATYPEPAIVVGQAGLLGLMLALFAAVLHYLARRPASVPEVPRPAANAVVERSSTDRYYRTSPAPLPSSTSPAMAIEQPSSESQV